MRIARWQGPPNYGDDLNSYIWPKVLHARTPDYLPNALFHGIGSILGARMPYASHHIVFGAGAGYQGAPDFGATPSYVYFVRGPLTACLMAADPRFITDPGILIALLHIKDDAPTYPVSFMPRWNTLGSVLEDGCRAAGIHLINPTDSVPAVTEQIAATSLLLTEALHGAVVADALRVPWICIRAQDGHDFKWRDWTGAMDMVWNPISAEHQGLSWARDFAVPQLSALSTHTRKLEDMKEAILQFNAGIEKGDIFA
jgi:succinoglycan biosynthesis protein ExoV